MIFIFTEKTAHAAASPEEGINALDAVIQLYNSINALRQQLPSDVKIHGVITEGGKAPNIIPDYAAARFFIRAATRKRCAEVTEKVKNIAQGAALHAHQLKNFHYPQVTKNVILSKKAS